MVELREKADAGGNETGDLNDIIAENYEDSDRLNDGETAAIAELSENGLYVPADIRRDISELSAVNVRFLYGSVGTEKTESFAFPSKIYDNGVLKVPKMVRDIENLENGDTLTFAVSEGGI